MMGVHEQSLSRIERGLHIPKVQQLIELANKLDVDISYFFQEQEEIPAKQQEEYLLQKVLSSIAELKKEINISDGKFDPVIYNVKTKPVLRSIVEMLMSLDTSTLHEVKGAVDYLLREKKYRTISEKPIEKCKVVFLGATAAGRPLDISTEPEVFIEVPASMIKGDPRDYFVVQAKGSSMKDVIHDGALVLIKKSKIAESGQIVLIRHHNESTIKRFRKDADGNIFLEYMDGSYKRIPIHDTDWEIQGIFIGVISETEKGETYL